MITTTDVVVAADAVADVVSAVVDVAAALKGEVTEVMKPTACQKLVIGNYA